MSNKSRVLAALALVAAAALLSACGGGSDSPPVTSQVPQSAVQSIGGWISYLQALVASPADTLEPVDVTGIVPPTDETSSPASVD